MSEISVKSAAKKGFTAPVLKTSDSKFGSPEIKAEKKNPKNGIAKKTENKENDEKLKEPKNKEIVKKSQKTQASNKNLINKDSKKLQTKEVVKKTKETHASKDNLITEDSNKLQTKETVKKVKSSADNVNHTVPKKQKKPEVSLTDSQYEDIFSAVLTGQRSRPNSQQNTPATGVSEENTPTVEVRGSSKQSRSEEREKLIATPGKQAATVDTTKTPPSNRNQRLPELSPWGSHFSKQPSQSSSILKELQQSQTSLISSSALMSPQTTSSSEDEDVQTSQRSLRQLSQISGYGSQSSQPATLPRDQSTNQRQRLEELQQLRNVGVWVYCCRQSCQKQRYLADITDPQDVPNIWYCHMNPDRKYNSCHCEEQKLSPEEEADMIFNEFTAGSVVWARVEGYPWWPAMVDDDPDLEQYYWLHDDNFNVTFYHVVFFDEGAVTRAWVSLKNISAYGKNDNQFRNKTARGIDFTRRILVAKEQANDALTLTTSQRLKIYSFIARYKGPITTSSTKAKKTMRKYKLKVKIESKTSVSVKEEKLFGLTTKEKSSLKRKLEQSQEKSAKKKKGKKDLEEQTLKSKKTKNKKDNKDEHNKNAVQRKKLSPKKNKEKEKAIGEEINKEISNVLNSIDNHLDVISDTEMKGNNAYEEANRLEENIETVNLKHNEHLNVEGLVNSPNIIEETVNENTDNKINDQEQKIHVPHHKDESTTKETNVQLCSEEIQVQPNRRADPRISSDKENIYGNSNKEEDKNPSTNISCENTNAQTDSETPSNIEPNLSQKSKSSERLRRCDPRLGLNNTEETIGSVVEPSQGGARREVQEQEHSQNTIADFFAAESQDAVVPDAFPSDQSQPFEE